MNKRLRKFAHWEQSPGFYCPSIRMDANSHDAMVIAREWN